MSVPALPLDTELDLLDREARRGEELTNRVRGGLCSLSWLLLLASNVNTPAATERLLGLLAVWSLYTVWLGTWQRFGRSGAWVKYLSLTVDHLVVGACYFATQVNHSGVMEYWRGGVLLAFALWNLLAGLRLSWEASVYSTVLTLVINGVLLTHTVSTGATRVSETSSFGGDTLNIEDQMMMILFVALPGVVAAILARRSSKLVVQAGTEARQRELLQAEHERLGKYLPRAVVDVVLRDPNRSPLSGERREVTVMFVDIREFTTISQHLRPEDTVEMPNRFFAEMVDVLFLYGGTLDKFLGDGFMAVFGSPLPSEDGATRAAMAAIDMVQRSATLTAPGGGPFRIGVAIASGVVLSGTVGSPERMEFTCIGPAVNLAARLEAFNKELGTSIVLAPATREQLDAGLSVNEHGSRNIRGVDAPVMVWSLDPDAQEPELMRSLRQRLGVPPDTSRRRASVGLVPATAVRPAT